MDSNVGPQVSTIEGDVCSIQQCCPKCFGRPIACQWLREALTTPPSCRNRKRRQDGRRKTIIGDPTNGGYVGQYRVALHLWPFYAGSKICVCNNVNHGVLVMVSWVCMLNGW